jgi:hypothetical protein
VLVASGASLVLGALVTLAGPPDLLTRCARRSSPIVHHAFGWGSGFGGFFHEGAGHDWLLCCGWVAGTLSLPAPSRANGALGRE